MKILKIVMAVAMAACAVCAQSGGPIIRVVDRATGAAIADARITIRGAEGVVVTDADGRAEIPNGPAGRRIVEVFSPGYEVAELSIEFPVAGAAERVVRLTTKNELSEVTVTTTRTGREIEADPSRVEAIDEEEIDEKISMQPANVSMVLHESTGIQVQQTSVTSNTQSVRIQGLDGRYTQILKDGFPAYGGFSGSLSVLEIPPLDLRQVEVIKGPSATLFGGDAIAGVVNFVTKDPSATPVTTIILNQTSALGSDASVFNSRQLKRFGYTFLGSFNYQKAYDVDGNGFSELPSTKSFAASPKFVFKFGEKTNLTIGNSTSFQNRIGGDMSAIAGRADENYFERNESRRNVTTISLNRDLDGGGRLLARQSVAFFNREITAPGYRFKGRQVNLFSEVSVARAFAGHALVFGANAVNDRFRETATTTPPAALRDETRTTGGVFVQDTVDLSGKLSLDAGLRLDFARNYGTIALPRVSALYRLGERLTTRAGVGFGYKIPTMFTEDAETLLFRNVAGVGVRLRPERSVGGTFDVNYRGASGQAITYSINQMFFYTAITDAIVLRRAPDGVARFANADSSVISKGFETNARIGYRIAKLFAGYTYTNARAGFLPGDRYLTLLPRHKINASLVFERPESFKTGIEFYFGSSQTLEDRSRTRALGEIGLFGEKTFGRFSLFINGENLTDVRQSRYGTVVFPPFRNPAFAESYTHAEGRVFNGGVKIRL